MMPYGIAVLAFLASSLMCTTESRKPMVQSGDKKLRMKVNPFGHVVSGRCCYLESCTN